MIINKTDLAKKLNCSLRTLDTYLGRQDFADIKKQKINRVCFIANINDNNIKLLKSYIHTRHRQKDSIYKGVKNG